MKERLTERKYGFVVFKSSEAFKEALNRLAEYEDLEEQGLLVRLPCKVGDKVYFIEGGAGELFIEEHSVSGFKITDQIYVIFRISVWEHYDCPIEEILATRAEAEKKLKELKGEE